MGFMSMGPLGALAGYFIGAWFDRKTAESQGAAQGTAEERARFEQGQRNSFLFSMLVMASYVMRADKRVMHSEMEFVRRFLRTNFGESAVEQGEQIASVAEAYGSEAGAGTHLHFEMTLDGEQTDPAAYLDPVYSEK